MSVGPHVLAGVRISSAVLPHVVGGELRGTVVSAYRAALNLLRRDQVVTITLVELGVVPNGVTVMGADDLRAVAALGEVIVVDVSSALPWSPILRPFASPPSFDAVARAARAAAARAPSRGFGPLLRSLDEDDDDLFRAAARPALRLLGLAAQSGDPFGAAEAARSLVGLGAGLTPSGDDVLVGLTAALTAARSELAGPIARAAADSGMRTTLVARTYLEHAARGEFAERVHDLVAAIAAGDERMVWDAMSWGATSGADLSLGVFLGAQASWPSSKTRAA